jgi:hypothetical protein
MKMQLLVRIWVLTYLFKVKEFNIVKDQLILDIYKNQQEVVKNKNNK